MKSLRDGSKRWPNIFEAGAGNADSGTGWFIAPHDGLPNEDDKLYYPPDDVALE